MKKIFLVEVEPILNYPPVLSVISILLKNDFKVILCVSSFPDSLMYLKSNKNLVVIDYGREFSDSDHVLVKMINLFKIRHFFWKEIKHIYQPGDLLWIFSAQTLKHLGKRVLDYKYVLHLFELIEELYYMNNLKIGKMGLGIYCQKAYKVVVCEYNRSFITAAWFGLERLPTVLYNKPYYMLEGVNDTDNISKKQEIADIMDKLLDKKIILYQGIIDEERPLETFIEAVNSLGDDYAMVIMGRGSERYNTINSNNLYCIPFIIPPYHLEITRHAYIGILSYIPSYNNSLSKLNPIYCAPNKLFEYAQFGIPMLGNHIPGLKYTIEAFQMGLCVDLWDVTSVREKILEIDAQYTKYSLNSRSYYESIDVEKIVLDIIN